MDNLTHSLIGVTAANAGLKKKFGPGTMAALVVSSNLPDIDVFWGFVNHMPNFFYRRMLTHSLLIMPVLAFLGAWIQRRISKSISLANLFALYLLGIGLHLVFDLVNSFGVVVFYPLSRMRLELAWVFIVDLALWALMLLPLLLSRIRSRYTDLTDLSRIAARCVAIYVLACGVLHWNAGRALARASEALGQKPTFSYVFPEPLGPQRFRGVALEGPQYRIFRINSVLGKAQLAGEVVTEESNQAVKIITKTPIGRKAMWFAKAPVWSHGYGAVPGVQIWTVRDLRFESLVLPGRNYFTLGWEVTDNTVRYLGRVRAGARGA
ncbi:MAG: metal-dependent hydrolase [Elusimicrobia bacterium]|nr:metal-dependent hydrolase [Elusimicrobiota bacterium]